MADRYDLIVIGAGPGGYEAAIEAAKSGMKTALIERRELGGTCLNRGCIPTKTLLHTAELYREVRGASTIGLEAENLRCDMAQLQARKNAVVEQLRGGIASLMKANKVTVIQGSASIVDSGRVRIEPEGTELETEHILIATGSTPAVPPIPGADLPGVVTSDELLDCDALPQSLVIIGGGVIGMEFASVFSALGCRVTVIEALERILANMDKEISQNLKMIMKKRGVDIHASAMVQEIAADPEGGLICRYAEKDKPAQAQGGLVLIATGRRACTEGLFAADASEAVTSMAMERGRIQVNGRFETSVPGIYAIGDVTGGIQLAHAATAQWRNAVAAMAGKEPSIDLSVIPGCVYTDPEIGCAGITADEAKAAGLEIISRKYVMGANGKSVLSGQERGFIKIVAASDTHRILGAQMMCARATDMISQFSAAIVNGLTLEDLARVVFPHPTFSEAIGEAAR